MNKDKLPKLGRILDINDIVPERFIARAFEGTRFGGEMTNIRARKILAEGVSKRLAGYSTGHTVKCCMIECGLLTEKLTVTKRGRSFLFHWLNKRGVWV